MRRHRAARGPGWGRARCVIRPAVPTGGAGPRHCAARTRWSRPVQCRARHAARVSSARHRRSWQNAAAAGRRYPARSARGTARRPDNRSPGDTGDGYRWRCRIRSGARSRTPRRCRTANRQSRTLPGSSPVHPAGCGYRACHLGRSHRPASACPAAADRARIPTGTYPTGCGSGSNGPSGRPPARPAC
ncbi:hypothetical protein D3C73_1221110 [compost metagenome]